MVQRSLVLEPILPFSFYTTDDSEVVFRRCPVSHRPPRVRSAAASAKTTLPSYSVLSTSRREGLLDNAIANLLR